jgi:hypothetical protein
MGRLLFVAGIAVVAFYLWGGVPLRVGQGSVVENQLRSHLDSYAERGLITPPKSVSCDKFGKVVSPPMLGGYNLSRERVTVDQPDFTIYACDVVYEDGQTETWCASDENAGYGIVAHVSDCNDIPRAVPNAS